MTAVPVNEPPPLSLIESAVAGVAGRARRRAARTGEPVRPSVLWWWVAELFGTVAGLAAFTVGAFFYLPPIVGYAVLGVSLLVLDTKVSGARRRRMVAAREAAVPPPAAPKTPVRYQ